MSASSQPPALDPLTACLIRAVLVHLDEQRVDLNTAVDLLGALVACDREHRAEQPRAEQ